MWAIPGRAQPLLRIQFQQHPGGSLVYHSYFPISALSPSAITPVAAGKGQLKLYPNPVRKILSFEGIAQPATVTVTDLSGRKVESASITLHTSSVDVHALPAGLYLLQVVSASESAVKMFQVAE